MACRSRYTRAVYTGLDLDRDDCRVIRKIGGWCERLFLSDHLPTVYQLGLCANRVDAGAVRAFAENQPVTSIVDAIRSLLSGSRLVMTFGLRSPGVWVFLWLRMCSPCWFISVKQPNNWFMFSVRSGDAMDVSS